MFLRTLKSEQKPLFLGLAYQAANANGVVESSEKRLINGFAEELGIAENNYSTLELEEICNNLVEISSRKELIEMSFEILGVMMGDTTYDEDEKAFMKEMNKIFGVSDDILKEMEDCLREYLAIYKKIEKITML